MITIEGIKSFVMPNFLTILFIILIHMPYLKSDCQNSELHHCNCVNVSQPQLKCPEFTTEHFVYESIVSENSEEMILKCSQNVNRSILNDIELVGVAGQSNSVKMVGCSSGNGTEISRHCTPVISISGFFSTIWNFFSFSYTYSKGKNPRVIDLVGCSDMENPASMNKIKTLTNADAITLFDFEGKDRRKILKRYYYYGNKEAVDNLTIFYIFEVDNNIK